MTENTKIYADFRFSFDSGSENLYRVSSLVMKFVMKSFDSKKLAKIWRRRDFLKYRRWFMQASWKLLVLAKWYLSGVRSRYSLLKTGSCQKQSPRAPSQMLQILFEFSGNQRKFHATTRVQLKVVSNRLFRCTRKNAK